MKEIVYVVMNPELGWDCIVGVYSNEEAANKWLDKGEEYVVVKDIVRSTFDN